jgi:hypothetical protein
MGSHLSDDALLELAETGKRHSHADRCEVCVRRIEELREAVAAARQVEVPEPSPLFWEHFTANVRESIGASRPGSRAGADSARGLPLPLRWFAYVTLALVLVVVGAWSIESMRRGRAPAAARTDGAPQLPAEDREATVGLSESANDDASWDLVTDIAATVDLETATDAAGLSLQPGAAERAALQMSPDEQRELVRLLQAAIEQQE